MLKIAFTNLKLVFSKKLDKIMDYFLIRCYYCVNENKTHKLYNKLADLLPDSKTQNNVFIALVLLYEQKQEYCRKNYYSLKQRGRNNLRFTFAELQRVLNNKEYPQVFIISTLKVMHDLKIITLKNNQFPFLITHQSANKTFYQIKINVLVDSLRFIALRKIKRIEDKRMRELYKKAKPINENTNNINL